MLDDDVLDDLYILYKTVIEQFKSGNDLVYHPLIFRNLTFDRFAKWYEIQCK